MRPDRFPGVRDSHPGRLHAVMAEFQVLVSEVCSGQNPISAIRRLRQRLVVAPRSICLSDRISERAVILEIFGRSIGHWNLSDHALIMRTLLGLAYELRSPLWEERAGVFLDRCLAVLESGDLNAERVPPLILRAIDELDCRYRDRAITAERLADTLGVSVSHLQHMLRTHSGRTFLDHLHERRIAAARQLLRDTALPIHAIAAQVGYSGACQLRRRLTSKLRVTPRDLRRGER